MGLLLLLNSQIHSILYAFPFLQAHLSVTLINCMTKLLPSDCHLHWEGGVVREQSAVSQHIYSLGREFRLYPSDFGAAPRGKYCAVEIGRKKTTLRLCSLRLVQISIPSLWHTEVHRPLTNRGSTLEHTEGNPRNNGWRSGLKAKPYCLFICQSTYCLSVNSTYQLLPW